ncbi:MAG: DegT/DnrJ/EryC1/StrS family aminotransferase, partial [Candidatus Zixiibacteriota bacterium]
AEHVIAVSSGTAALDILFHALELPDERPVLIPSFAWPSAANVALLHRLVPVFVDADPSTYNVALSSLGESLDEVTASTKAKPVVLPVHQFGLPCPMTEIRSLADRYDALLLEDAACALGAECDGLSVGRFGTAGIFSFHPRKSITTGEGGAIVTADADLARRCRAFRDHGRLHGYDFITAGLNYRLTEMQAAIGQVQLTRLPAILKKRQAVAEQYCRLLADCSGLTLPNLDRAHTWQTFMVLLDERLNRDNVIAGMRQGGIEVGIGSLAAHLLPQFRDGKYTRPLPVSERLFRHGLALPMHSLLTPQEVNTVACVLRETVSHV